MAKTRKQTAATAAPAADLNEVAALLPLDIPRKITLGSGADRFTYCFRRIALADWLAFFAGIVHQTLQQGDVRDTVYESESTQLELVNKTLISVTGYGDLAGLKDWRKALPLKHRLAVGLVLRSVGPSRPGKELAPLSDLAEIRLDAMWSADEKGKTSMYAGLVHRFRQPSIEQLRRFNFETARVRVEGTSQSGITSYPSRQLVAMKIYDELIDQVEGYAAGGKALEGIENIQREMDGAHKAEAALALFSQGEFVRVQ